ncbi:conserved phage C-terminal domain-containing protein [Erwinia amylovora]|uniref:conserved phage C-terminal domain-containing protein n=1 Tax=Erwinia amylovora TaxID=552 RepID=UPI001443A5A5|nr:conserved phage C-terminal domain-containing protein [Erwinia amylovora]
MSSKLHGLVWEGCGPSGMTLSRIAVLARLADYSNDDGYSWPAVDTIREQVGAKSKTTIRAALRELESAGWLSVKERRSGGRNISNAYQLDVEKLEQAAEAARKKKRQVSITDPSKINPPKIDPPKIDPSNSDPSIFDGSNNDTSGGQNLVGEGSTIDPDPLIDPKTDPSDKKHFCQPPAETDPEVAITDFAKQVLTHLNLITGSRYQVCKSSLENLRARLGEGFTVDELILTADYLNAKWSGDLEMAEYLRPATMFQPSKFPGYFSGAQKWLEAGRPNRVNGRWVSATGETLGEGNAERDAAYRRFIGSGKPLKSPSQLEQTVTAEASKAGVRSMNASFAVSRWNSIWKESAARQQGEKAA